MSYGEWIGIAGGTIGFLVGVSAVIERAWNASRVYVTKAEYDKRCESVDERFDRVSNRVDRLDERQQKHELLTARLEASISGLERAVNSLTRYLQSSQVPRPHCAVATDVPQGRDQ